MNNIQFQGGVIDASGCVSNGWELVKKNYGLYLGITVIAIILSGCIPCVSLFLVGPIMGGVYYVVLREMQGHPVDFGMMFKGFDKFVPLMVVGIVQSIPEIIAQILRVTADVGQIGLDGATRGGDLDFYQASSDTIPFAIASGVLVMVIIIGVVLFFFGIVWRILLFFAIPLVMEHNIGPVDAMKLSARAAMSNVGGLILLFVLEILVGLLGLLMLCIGIFFVLPIIYAASAFAYRQVFPLFEQSFRNVPPSPDIYGSSFGRGQ